MSEFLQDLLKKVKQNADALEVPLAESDSERDSTPAASSRQKKIGKPSSPAKSVSGQKSQDEPSLLSEPGSLPESGITTVSGLPTQPGLPTKPGLVTESDGESGLLSEPGSLPESVPLQLLKLFADSRAAINSVIPSMKESELHLYYYLADRSYGNQRTQSEGLITYSQKEAMKGTGIKSTATIVKAMNSLCKKKLVKWVRKARKRGEISQIRVFLPEDVQEFRSRSDASNSK